MYSIFRIVALYVLFSVLWVYFSDRLLVAMQSRYAVPDIFNTYKGWAFILVSGGLLGGRITAVPGSSRVFEGGVIAYSNEVTSRELGVPAADIAAHGAVSETVARAMASGVRRRFGTTIGIGITGIAGPDGGTDEKPVGTVWVAVDMDGDVHATRSVLPGDRNEIRHRGTQLALDRLRRAFQRDTAAPGWTARA